MPCVCQSSFTCAISHHVNSSGSSWLGMLLTPCHRASLAGQHCPQLMSVVLFFVFGVLFGYAGCLQETTMAPHQTWITQTPSCVKPSRNGWDGCRMISGSRAGAWTLSKGESSVCQPSPQPQFGLPAGSRCCMLDCQLLVPCVQHKCIMVHDWFSSCPSWLGHSPAGHCTL